MSFIWWKHPTDVFAQKQLYIDLYKSIGIAFWAVLLGALIPSLLAQKRANLDRARGSRIAYSEAKTAVVYLPGMQAVLDYGKAMDVLEKAHRKLHEAETYPTELAAYLDWYDNDRVTWSDQIYWELTAVRRLLQSRADTWDEDKLGRKTTLVDEALEQVRALFGERGRCWKALDEGKRDEFAKDLVDEIVAQHRRVAQ